jgi:hypothetical protein
MKQIITQEQVEDFCEQVNAFGRKLYRRVSTGLKKAVRITNHIGNVIGRAIFRTAIIAIAVVLVATYLEAHPDLAQALAIALERILAAFTHAFEQVRESLPF